MCILSHIENALGTSHVKFSHVKCPGVENFSPERKKLPPEEENYKIERCDVIYNIKI